MTATIPADFLAILAIVVSAISNYLRDAGLPKWANSIIAAGAILLIGLLTIWISTGFSADPKTDVLLFCSILVSLFSGLKELNDLLNYLRATPSPIAPTGQIQPVVDHGSISTNQADLPFNQQ